MLMIEFPAINASASESSPTVEAETDILPTSIEANPSVSASADRLNSAV